MIAITTAPATLARVRTALAARWFAPAPAGPLGLCRALFFAVVLLRVAPAVDSAPWAEVERIFWMPTDLFALLRLDVAPAGVLRALDGAFRLALALAAIGLCSRAATALAFLLGLYVLGLPQCFGKIDHWSGLLVLTMGVLALARSGDAWSVDAWLRRRRGAPSPPPSGEYRWPIELARLLLVLVFFAAGIAKLRQGGLAWLAAENMRAILLAPHYANDRTLPALGLHAAALPLVCSLLAIATLVGELGAPLALLGGLPAAVVIGVLFAMQAGIATLLGVHATFPYLACYVFWLPWRRAPEVAPASRPAAATVALDAAALRARRAGAHGRPPIALRPRRSSRRGSGAILALVLVLAAGTARADDRCAGALQDDVCVEATGSCPALPPPLGVAASAWPVFQHDLQHTGRSPHDGPGCPDLPWTAKLAGKVLAAPALGGSAEGEALFVAAAKYPLCALDPDTGAVRWCDTDQAGKLPDVSSPALGNGGLAYVGTRDNDLWAITVPPLAASTATVAWRQKICTDGDVSTSPVIGADGVVYMGSNSLAGGTLMAMCPGSARRVKWCVNPLGGTLRNVSPALSPDQSRLYVTYLGVVLVALDPATGDVVWRLTLQTQRNNLRSPNYTPVVHPTTGRIFVGLDGGLYAVDVTVDPTTHAETPAATLLVATRDRSGERIQSPPALDVDRGHLYFGASRGNASTFYAVALDGTVLWTRADLGKGRYRNMPPVVDRSGRIYVVLGKSVYALDPSDGHTLWRLDLASRIASSPIVAPGRLYLGTGDGRVIAIGCS